jgi:hypothetical protein
MRLQSDRLKLRKFEADTFLTKPSDYKSSPPVPVRVRSSGTSKASTAKKAVLKKKKKRKAQQEEPSGEYIEMDYDTLESCNTKKKMKVDDVKLPDDKKFADSAGAAAALIAPPKSSCKKFDNDNEPKTANAECQAGLPTQTEKNPLNTPDFSQSTKNYRLKIP